MHRAQTHVGSELKHARVTSAKDNVKDNLKEHLLKDPAVQAGGSAADGPDSGDTPHSGSGTGASSGSSTGGPGPCAPGQHPFLPPGVEPGADGVAS